MTKRRQLTTKFSLEMAREMAEANVVGVDDSIPDGRPDPKEILLAHRKNIAKVENAKVRHIMERNAALQSGQRDAVRAVGVTNNGPTLPEDESARVELLNQKRLEAASAQAENAQPHQLSRREEIAHEFALNSKKQEWLKIAGLLTDDELAAAGLMRRVGNE